MYTISASTKTTTTSRVYVARNPGKLPTNTCTKNHQNLKRTTKQPQNSHKISTKQPQNKHKQLKNNHKTTTKQPQNNQH
jgi:hypothetical protein